MAISVKGFNDNVCIFNLDNLALCVNKDKFPCDHISDEQRYYLAKISFQKPCCNNPMSSKGDISFLFLLILFQKVSIKKINREIEPFPISETGGHV